MWQRVYLQRLKRDLELWIERGLITPANAQVILASYGEEAGIRRIPQILALLGAVLIGFAAMSFVAANWSEIPKLVKLLLLFTALWTAWGAAIFLHRRGHPAFAEAAVVAGLALFGGNIMLIAQIYHVDAGAPGWVLLWSLVALAAAWALPSRASLAIGILLAILWSAWSPPALNHAHWAFFLPWLLALVLAIRLSWLPGFHLAMLTAWIWAGLNGEPLTSLIGCGRGDLAVIYVLVALLLWLVGIGISARSLRFGTVLECYGIAVAFALIWILQVMPPDSDANLFSTVLTLIGLLSGGALAYRQVIADRLSMRDLSGLAALAIGAALYPLFASSATSAAWIYAALFTALSVWLVAYGTGRNNRFALNAGFAAFAVEILYLYFQTLGTLLGTAAFFALGGIILIAGSLLMARIRRRVVAVADEGKSS
ncbi:MAG: DUF2157 domain-containing protein [Parvibaculum sp.]|uniref:DUF2157 domain-containing protein n=1 Tax=Parvibaculum sp. TaxID=2024848 RepID=UPI0025EE67C8|nr:DUF2157 domain-containing protein [Parvibaculum sp.]MCE9651308.1 DUF2157 domain-containing protein [Parvibaculum sp.]